MAEEQAHILVVDDNASNRYVVARILRRAGYRVAEAGTGAEALEAVKEHPDLIILDISLPDINGFDLCKQLKAAPGTASISILHLSASYTQDRYKAQGLEGGADSYLTHPVEPLVLLGTVSALLRLRRAEKVLRSSAIQWRTTFDAISDAVCLLDMERRVLRCNLAMAALLRRPLSDIIGQCLDPLVRESLGDPVASPGVVNQGGRINLEQKFGSSWYRLTSDPWLDDDGHSLGTVQIMADITDRKRVEQAQRLLAESSAALSASLEYPMILETIGKVAVPELADESHIFVPNARGIQRVGPADAGGSPPAETSAAVDLVQHLAERVLQTGQSEIILSGQEPLGLAAAGDEVPRAPDTESRRSYMAVPLVARSQNFGVLVLGSAPGYDYHPSELSLAEDLGRRAAIALENARLFHDARAAVRTRDEFLAVVSHDLRNPLSTILLSTAAFIRSPFYQKGEPSSRGLIDRVRNSAQQMERLINELLDMASIEAGHLPIDIDLHPVRAFVAEVMELYWPLAEAKSLKLVTEVTSSFEARFDRQRLFQVFSNLVGNAMKFTPPGGSIVLGARSVEQGVLFSVRDNGAGIAPAELPWIFDRFYQGRATGRVGVGLGLSIVKGIIQAHGGDIAVESVPGAGTTFSFLIPTEPVPAAMQD